MREQAVLVTAAAGQSDCTGERKALDALMCLMPLNCTHCQGIMAPGQKRLKTIHKVEKHARYFAL